MNDDCLLRSRVQQNNLGHGSQRVWSYPKAEKKDHLFASSSQVNPHLEKLNPIRVACLDGVKTRGVEADAGCLQEA